MLRVLVLLVSFFVLNGAAIARDAATLKAADGLSISADIYRDAAKQDAPWIVLTHQAGSSRGEYRTIAPRLNKLGFNAIAIDQRSGKTFAGVRNETAQRAAARGSKRSYAAAMPDIEAAIAWAREQTSGPVLLWGSSYSAALALWLAGQKPSLVDGVIAMSPGEYIRGRGIARAAGGITAPTLITSPAKERGKWQRIFKAIPAKHKVGYAPTSGGRHGSSALIAARNKSSEAYWAVVQKFLDDFKK